MNLVFQFNTVTTRSSVQTYSVLCFCWSVWNSATSSPHCQLTLNQGTSAPFHHEGCTHRFRVLLTRCGSTSTNPAVVLQCPLWAPTKPGRLTGDQGENNAIIFSNLSNHLGGGHTMYRRKYRVQRRCGNGFALHFNMSHQNVFKVTEVLVHLLLNVCIFSFLQTSVTGSRSSQEKHFFLFLPLPL